MQMRTKGNSPAVSLRVSKLEWEKFITAGNNFFKNRNIGYIQVAEKLSFSITSPYYKSLKGLDEANKERSDTDQINHEKVLVEITKKTGGK